MCASITGGILAGGRATRMNGQDKGLVILKQKPLIQYSIEAVSSIVDNVIISANRNFLEYQKFGFPVVSDNLLRFDGPLAGILRLMQATTAGYLLVMPCDCPLIGKEQIQKLLSTIIKFDFDVFVANDGLRIQPVIAVMKTELEDDLKNFLASGERKAETWVAKQHYYSVDFKDDPDIFQNVNSCQDLEKIKQSMNRLSTQLY